MLAPLAALALGLSLVMALLATPALAAGEVELVELWHKAYDSGHNDWACDVAVDSEDNIIVTGYTKNGDGNTDYLTIKYDQDGNEIWDKSYDGGNNDEAHGVAVDSEDNIIVTGYSNITGDYDYYTIKYDKDGNKIWSETYDDGNQDWAMGVAVDSHDNIIVTGDSRPSGGSSYLTIKYDRNGTEIWNNSTGGNEAFGVAVDSEDNVIVTGYSSNGSTDTNYYTIIYDQDGNEIATATYDSGYDDQAMGVAVDSEANIIVTGYSTNENGNKDYYTIKYETVPAGCGGLSGAAIAGIGVGAFVAGGLISYFISRRTRAG